MEFQIQDSRMWPLSRCRLRTRRRCARVESACGNSVLDLTDNAKPLDVEPEGIDVDVIVPKPLVAFFASVSIGR